MTEKESKEILEIGGGEDNARAMEYASEKFLFEKQKTESEWWDNLLPTKVDFKQLGKKLESSGWDSAIPINIGWRH